MLVPYYKLRSTEDKRVVEIDLAAKGRFVVDEMPEVAEGMPAKKLEILPKKGFLTCPKLWGRL